MEDIIRKQMNDVIVPQNDVIRRPQVVPEPYIAPIRDDEGDRIGKNPFFEKPQKKALEPQKGSGAGKGVLFALLFALLLALGFFTANYFAMATIDVTPITRSATLNSDLVALREGGEDEFDFDTTTISDQKQKEVPVTIEKNIQQKASGKVTIFNAYNGESQRLIKNTRLESSNGKIYHIENSVVVPGAKIVSGKVVTPGSVEVLVYAAMPGDGYNLKLLDGDFTIPGFKGDPRFAKFYGRMSEKDPVDDGLSRTVKVPSDEAIKVAQEELKQDLKKIVVEKARADIPAGKTFFPGSIIVRFEEVPQDFSPGNESNVSMRATVSVFFFDTAELTKKIAELLPPEDRENPFSVTNMSALNFKLVDPVDNVVLSDIEKIRFHLSGSADFVGQIDSKKISADFAGKSKKDISVIIKKQINVGGANVIIRPIWKSVFPSDPAKITVKIISK